MYTNAWAQQEKKHNNTPQTLICLGLFFSTLSGVVCDFATTWDSWEIIYELATILGVAMSAMFYKRHMEKARIMVAACTLLSVALLIIMTAAGIAVWSFTLIRFFTTPLIVLAFWRAASELLTKKNYIFYSLSITAAYVLLSVFIALEMIPRYFGIISAAACVPAAIILFITPQAEKSYAGSISIRTALHAVKEKYNYIFQSRSLLFWLLAITLLYVLFNSADAVIFSEIIMAGFSEAPPQLVPLSIFLIGAGYMLGGLILKKLGIIPLFISSFVLTHVFLVLTLIPGGLGMMLSFLPLYILGTAAMDMFTIIFPMFISGIESTPLSYISGFMLFRIMKLDIIRLFLPIELLDADSIRLIFGIMLILTLILILGVSYTLAKRKSDILIITEEAAQSSPLPDTLTKRELEIAKLLLEGKDRGEIAKVLEISFSTVNKHCVSIYRKTGCASHLELLKKHGELSPKKPE